MENIAVNLMNGPQGSTLTIREGQALDLKEPQRLVVSGQIETVKRYLDARRATEQTPGALQHIDKDLAIISIDEEKLTITLDVDPNNYYGTRVVGQLLNNPDLDPFKINKGHRFTRESFLELITFRRRFFDDRGEWDALKAGFQRLSIKTSGEINANSDKRGNAEHLYKKEVTSSGIAETFKLKMPIYKGQPDRSFVVDLCLDVTDAGPRFYLESNDLIELADADRKVIMSEQVKGYLDYCIIWK